METRTAPSLLGGRYRIDGMLGEGGMARVFDAFDERLERPVAVKILRSETLALPGMRQRFQQEALIAARLIHPHIVAVLDFGEQKASSYLVMERLPGSTLRDEIVARGPLPTQRVLGVMAETLGALAAAHKFGVLHRDIKPSNILLQEDGHTKITDFGIAKSFDMGTDLDVPTDDMTMTGVVLGTPGYLAPERRSGQPATVQSDLYSVGAVMVETLTGQRLAPGAAATEGLPPPLRDVALPGPGHGPTRPLRIGGRDAPDAPAPHGRVDRDRALGAPAAVDTAHDPRARPATTAATGDRRPHSAAPGENPGPACSRAAPTRPAGRCRCAGPRGCARASARGRQPSDRACGIGREAPRDAAADAAAGAGARSAGADADPSDGRRELGHRGAGHVARRRWAAR